MVKELWKKTTFPPQEKISCCVTADLQVNSVKTYFHFMTTITCRLTVYRDLDQLRPHACNKLSKSNQTSKTIQQQYHHHTLPFKSDGTTTNVEIPYICSLFIHCTHET